MIAQWALVSLICGVSAILIVPGNSEWFQPAATIKIIVPSAPGGGADILSRLLADQIGRVQGVKMFVENRPGAGNTIGTEVASRAAPDGNTLLISTPEFVINAHLRKLNYDPLTAFEPICYLVRSPQLIVVRPDSPYRTFGGFVAGGRAKPGELTLASPGPASAAHIAFEAFKRAADVNITFVPYPGATPAVEALLGGFVTSVFASYPNVAELVRTGKLRALATTSATRIEQMPDVPTVVESGFKDFVADIWYGAVAPAKTPTATIAQLAALFTAALQAPDVKTKLAAQGQFPVSMCGPEFGDFIHKQYDEFGRAIREANIKIE